MSILDGSHNITIILDYSEKWDAMSMSGSYNDGGSR